MGVPLAALLVVALGADPAADLAPLRAAHGRALAELGRRAVEEQLFNDAERLLEEARVWAPEIPGLRGQLEGLATLRKVRIAEPARDEYREYLESDAFGRARAALHEAEGDAAKGTCAAVVELARAAHDAGDAAAAEAALRLALDLGLDDRALARVLGGRDSAALRKAWEAERGLGRLELGERLSGRPLGPRALEGRVVLWRSFSL